MENITKVCEYHCGKQDEKLVFDKHFTDSLKKQTANKRFNVCFILYFNR